MKLISTIFSNYQLLATNDGEIKSLIKNEEVAYSVGDIVVVTPDSMGYICPGVTRGGLGKITKMREDSTDYWIGVKMNDGQFGYMKDSRVTKVKVSF